MATSSTSGITFGGIASGLDTEGIIQKLVAVETSSISRLTQQQKTLQQKADLYDSFKGQISGLAQAVNALNTTTAFQAVSVGVTDTSVLSVTTSTGTQPGSYTLKVSKLAQAEKISSAAQASTSTALGQTGQFVVNGKVVTVDATDSLQSIASKVNALNVGVSAGVINGGANQAYLTFTSSQTGLQNKPQLADLTGNLLSSIGILSGTSSIRQTMTNGAVGSQMTSSSTAVGSMVGASGLSSQTFQVNGVGVTVDLSTDTLQDVADKINSASTGATASVVAVQNAGVTSYQLQVVGSSSTPTFTDSGNTLAALGILQNNPTNELVQAQDAQYSIDNVNLTSATNTITDVIAGATVTLLKADSTTPVTSTINLTSDASAVAERVKGVMTAYNQVGAFINQYSQFDASTYATGPLFGDSLVQQYQSSVHSALMSNVPGLTGTYKNLIDIGFGLDTTGNMTVDDTKLQAAISADPVGVQRIFQNFGTTTSGSLGYVSSTSDTLTSSTGNYDINITQAATKSQYIAGTTKTTANTTSEKLTFAGSMFSNGSVDITIDIGSTMADIVNKINSDPRLKDSLVASDNGGKLQVDSKKYGTNGRFTLVSNQSPTSDNSGVGFSAGTLTDGLDVAGTIAGQAATGVGQFLTGDTTNTVAKGLQIQYSGTTTGLVGSVNFTSGLNGVLNKLLNVYTDYTNGLTVTSAKSIRDQADELQTQIDAINKRAEDKATELRDQFAAMEDKISQLQSQGNSLSALLSSATTK
ncbi:MAG: flagellar filament capping protein FliD [Armatimonadetes bacterium]|nr:flagellar filament capping protein FliD [Armatimonadota bacterium]